MGRFEGKSAIVTGASRGIGREIALLLAKEGARVAVNYSGSKEKADEVVQMITESGGEAFAIQADVSDADSVKTWLIKRWKHLVQLIFL